jgi:hypothetical protein
MDTIIDRLISERNQAEAQGMRQNKRDSALLLALLLEDAKHDQKPAACPCLQAWGQGGLAW